MISLLGRIVSMFVCWVETAVTAVVNAFVAFIAATAAAVAALMPSMPAAPTLPSWADDGLAWAAWFFPVGTLLDVLAFMIAAFVIWTGVATILRWFKVVE